MLLRMNITKRLSILFFVIVTLLAACGISSTGNTSPKTNSTDVNNTAQSAAATLIAQTVIPTGTKLPPVFLPTSIPISIFTSTPTPTSTAVLSAPDGLRMAYLIDPNLYIQNGSKPPLQLTHGDMDRSPTFSDDGKKLVFLRRFLPHELHSINSDGSQEQLLVSGTILSSLGAGYDELSEIISFAFVPKTHLVLFNTRELSKDDVQSQDWQRGTSQSKNDLLMVDIDTGKIKILLPPGKGGGFLISPDGKSIAIKTRGHIDIVDIDAHIIHRNLVTYIPTQPYELEPGISWANDSTALIITLPVGTEYFMDGPETRSVWRYPIDGSARVQVSLNPPPIGSDYNVSPDGNWILYSYYYYPGKTSDTVPSGLYLGNLHDGKTQLYSSDITVPAWASDNLHFIYEKHGTQGLIIGTVGGQPINIEEKGHILGWIDSHRYLYYYATNGVVMLGDINGKTIEILNNVPKISIEVGEYAFVFLGDK